MKLCERCGACFDDAEDACGYDGSALSPVFPGPRIVGGRYLLEQRVAAGAMGFVVRATHLQVGSTVAVKLMRPTQGDRHVALARFQREAQILGQIKHPNAVLVIDFGVETRASQSVPFLVMEFLRGESLAARLERQGRLSLQEVERIFVPLCDAVEEAHAAGVIHRDLKPSNVVLERLRDGSEIVKVLDFGIAKFIARGGAPPTTPAPVSLADGAPVAASEPAGEASGAEEGDELDDLDELAELLADDDETEVPTVAARPPRSPSAERSPVREPTTEAGFMIGTVPYMAAEQMTGERVSRRTDVHAVAVMIFQCLAGRLPFSGDDDEVIAAKLADERPSLDDLGVAAPSALDEVLRSSFAVDPTERPAAVRELADALHAAASSTPSSSPATATSMAAELDAVAEALAPLEGAVRALAAARAGEDHYARARDLLLRLEAPLGRLRDELERAPQDGDVRAALAEARSTLDARVDGVRRALAHLGAHGGASGDEFADYLRALWSRLDVVVQRVLDASSVGSAEEDDVGLAATRLFAAVADQGGADLASLSERLRSRDALDGADALDELLASSVDAAVTLLRGGDEAAGALARGLWCHADSMLLHELAPGRRGFRLLPLLASLRLPAAAPFAVLAGVLSRATAGADDVNEALAQVPVADAPMLARCLLLHPSEAARAAAAAALEPSDLWSVIAHPATPLAVERFLFGYLRTRARAEYLKVFFFCVRDHLLAATSTQDLKEALALTRSFFVVPCFHEDIVFEPLLELEAAVRARAAASHAALDDEGAYAEAVASFTAKGAVETRPLESLMDVPLPIQRKLAREGHFLNFFVSHQNERVAKETLPHLLRLEDITPFLRITTIHRVLLTELAKRKRFFRKDAAKLALLQNPKTPALVARAFVPVVPSEQLRLLATNRHINPDVRRLIAAAVGVRVGPA
ncbi:MAG: serine/threonine protein kinase [Deltaproteobacteria bacterium]|nr:serine/threonine protein kinase [Deltaproteobacteria bacterium]